MGWDFYNHKMRIAHKVHICDLCGADIKKGEKYINQVGKYDGDFVDDKSHIVCQRLINEYCNAECESEYDFDSILDYVTDTYCAHCELYREDDCAESYIFAECPKILARNTDGE